MKTNPFREVLENTKISELFDGQPRNLVKLHANQTIEESLKVLASNDILSAPVFDAENKVLGMVDMLDIVSHVVFLGTPPDRLLNDKVALELARKTLSTTTTGSIVNISGTNPFLPCHPDESASSLIRKFAGRVHRVPVIDPQSKQIMAVISQMAVAKYLCSNKAVHIDDSWTVESVGLGRSDALTIDEDALVVDALKQIAGSTVSAVAVCHRNSEKLKGNFSASDIRGLDASNFGNIFLPINKYLELYSPQSLKPICCSYNTRLKHVMHKMVTHNVHRVWMVGSKNSNTSVNHISAVSLADVMAVFARQEL